MVALIHDWGEVRREGEPMKARGMGADGDGRWIWATQLDHPHSSRLIVWQQCFWLAASSQLWDRNK